MLRLCAVLLGGLGLLDLAYIGVAAGPRALAQDSMASRAHPPALTSAALRSPSPSSASPSSASPSSAASLQLPDGAAPAPEPQGPAPRVAPVEGALAAPEPEELVGPAAERAWIVMFPETGQASLSDAAEQQLRQIARKYSASHALRVSVVGHADSRGESELNRRLGAERARVVTRALLGAGFGAEQLEVRSDGEDSPAVIGATPDAWADNRRVEIQIEARRNIKP
jgi:peptidoglycan-associated lipoprotein